MGRQYYKKGRAKIIYNSGNTKVFQTGFAENKCVVAKTTAQLRDLQNKCVVAKTTAQLRDLQKELENYQRMCHLLSLRGDKCSYIINMHDTPGYLEIQDRQKEYTTYPVLLMEHGTPLTDLLRVKAWLGKVDILNIVERLINAVEAFHFETIAHMDIHEGNVVVQKVAEKETLFAKFIDFRLMRFESTSSTFISGRCTTTSSSEHKFGSPESRTAGATKPFQTLPHDVYCLGNLIKKTCASNFR